MRIKNVNIVMFYQVFGILIFTFVVKSMSRLSRFLLLYKSYKTYNISFLCSIYNQVFKFWLIVWFHNQVADKDELCERQDDFLAVHQFSILLNMVEDLLYT